MDSLAASARSALTQVAGLLNTTDGNVYVFSGQDTANPAVPNGDNILSSGFYTQIKAAVGALSANGAAATAASTLATASSNAAGTSPFSAFLSQGAACSPKQRSIVPLGDGQSAPTGLLASANAAVVSSGSSTTGSYMRDLMRALATIGSLSSSQSGDSANFDALVSDTRTSLRGAISAMADDVGVLGDAQTRFTADKTQIGDMQTALKTQLSSAAGSRHGEHAVAADSGADADAGFISAHRRPERPVPHEIPSMIPLPAQPRLHRALIPSRQNGATPAKRRGHA